MSVAEIVAFDNAQTPRIMERKEFEITINVPKEKVWKVLWDDETYRQWTAPFSPGSYAETDWKEGGKVRFLGPNGDGMVAKINERRGNEHMFVEHLGVVKDGVEDTESEKAQSWKGARENYFLSTVGGQTKLMVETDIAEEYLEEFQKSWPQALQKVKELSEQH